MYQGKYRNQNTASKKSMTLLVSTILIVGMVVAGTLAYLTTDSGPLQNVFNPSKVTTKVVETLDGEIKKDVKIQNTGDIDAWIRATVVVTWQDKDGNLYAGTPVAGTDYEIQYNTEDWFRGTDGFYYWKAPVAPNEMTGVLIQSCQPKKAAPAEGYYLTVEIIGSGLQSKPNSTFNSSWGASSGLTAANDALTKNS